MSDPRLDFDRSDLAAAVELLDAAAVDALPFGAIRVDGEGIVRRFSRAESVLSGFGSRPALGQRFFVDVAPCFDNEAYLGRIRRALAAGTLDLDFAYVGDFADAERELRVRIQSASDGGYWIFMQRQD